MELERDPWRGVLRDLRRVTRRAELLEKSSVMPGAPVLDDLAVSYLAQRSMERWRSFPTPKVTGYARNRNTLLSCSTASFVGSWTSWTWQLP